MKIAFAGTPAFAATILDGLIDSVHDVGLVVSQPDRRRGRGRKLTKTPVAELALNAGLPLRQPARISEAAEEISTHDALVVAAYGQILRPDTLYAAGLGAWNVHASLLPAYRGAAPIERAVMNGETETGVSIMRMDEGLDTGPIALQRSIPIPPDMTGGALTQALADLGSNAIVEVLAELQAKALTLSEQNSLYATYAAKVEDEERLIRWAEGAEKVHDLIRALTPHIGARTFHSEFSGPIKVLGSTIYEKNEGVASSTLPGTIFPANGRILVACKESVLEILRLQAPAGRVLSAADFLRGRRLSGVFLT